MTMGANYARGSCLKCKMTTEHLMSRRSDGSEYFVCLKCGTTTDRKEFIYENLMDLPPDDARPSGVA